MAVLLGLIRRLSTNELPRLNGEPSFASPGTAHSVIEEHSLEGYRQQAQTRGFEATFR
jgi:hypothetical protein